MSTLASSPVRAGRMKWALGAVIVALVAGVAVWWATLPADDTPPVTQPPAALPDGETFAFISGLGATGIVADRAEMLTGEAARLAAVEDGVIEPGEDLPNDFYIRNGESTTVTVGAHDTATYQVLTFGKDGELVETEITYDALVSAFNGDANAPEIYGFTPEGFPVTLTVVDGEVTELVQVYLP